MQKEREYKMKVYLDSNTIAGKGMCFEYAGVKIGDKTCMECHYNRSSGALNGDYVYCANCPGNK